MIFDDTINNEHDQSVDNVDDQSAEATQEQNNDQSNELDDCKKELAILKDRYYYLYAEFDNYKKRYDKEQQRCIANAYTQVLKRLLPIIDDFERALNSQKDLPEEVKVHLKGSELIYHSLLKVLDQYNVSPIENVTVFNPEEHEAVMSVQSDDHKSGEIVQVVEKGYKYKDNVLRPAKVTVAA